MPAIVKSGSIGPGVSAVQTMLNAIFPDANPLLKVDTIFGPKTLARTIQFQKTFGLVPDGIVGNLTWAKLDQVCPLPPAVNKISCGNGDPGNAGRLQLMTSQVRSTFSVGDSPTPTGFLKPIRSNPHFGAASGVFFASLDYDRIFWTTQSGLSNRPFTLAVPTDSIGGFIQVLNLGEHFNRVNVVIHELVHAWQSQHHQNPTAYMAACVACQKKAVEESLAAVPFQPSVVRMDNFPVDRPFSAYGFIEGRAFGDYGGEMIADQVEVGVEAIRRIVRSAPANQPDSDNAASLTKVVATDMRLPGTRQAP